MDGRGTGIGAHFPPESPPAQVGQIAGGSYRNACQCNPAFYKIFGPKLGNWGKARIKPQRNNLSKIET